jgi:hypothetical protein
MEIMRSQEQNFDIDSMLFLCLLHRKPYNYNAFMYLHCTVTVKSSVIVTLV